MTGATAELEFVRAPGGRTAVSRSRVRAPLAFTRAFAAAERSGAAEAWLQSLAGGLVAGEEVTVRIEVRAGASAVVAPQSATVVFAAPVRAAAEVGPARLTVELVVAEGGRLEWLPRPTVLVPGANLVSSIVVRLEAGARVLLGEAYVQHRPVRAAGDRAVHGGSEGDSPAGFGSLTASVAVEVDGRLVAADRQRTQGRWPEPAHGMVWAVGRTVDGHRVDDHRADGERAEGRGDIVPLLLSRGLAAGALPNGAGTGVRAAGRPQAVQEALGTAIGLVRSWDPREPDPERLPS